MKIYTRTGDKGTTSLTYGQRISKGDIRVEAYGTCDEANSVIGLALAQLKKTSFSDANFIEVFHKIQTTLFHVGAEMSTPEGKEVKWKLEPAHITALETAIDDWENKLPPLKQFILPGGNEAGASFHVARTVVRRAERVAARLGDQINPLVLSYLNRLSDLLFVASRYVNNFLGEKEHQLHEDD